MFRRSTVLLVLAAVLAAAPALGQTAVGLELGSPSGFTLLLDRDDRTDLEFLAAWDLDDLLFVNGHMLWTAGETLEPGISFRYGPGVFVGFEDRDFRRNSVLVNDTDLLVGASFRVAAEYAWDQFAVYLALTPRLSVLERTEGGLGGALGFRMWL